MSNGEWTVLGIFIGVLVGTSVYNTLVLNRLQKTAKWNEVKLANPYNGHSNAQIAEKYKFAELIYVNMKTSGRIGIR